MATCMLALKSAARWPPADLRTALPLHRHACATGLAGILSAVDSANVTQNLWCERWTKLTANTITHGLPGVTGLDNRSVYLERGIAHHIGVTLAAEAVAVGRAQGCELGSIRVFAPTTGWRRIRVVQA